MACTLYGVQFDNGMWHNGYSHMSPAIGDAFLAGRSWAEVIANTQKPYGRNPTVVPVEFDRSIRIQEGRGDGNHPDLPLTPLAVAIALNEDDNKRGHFSF